MSDPTDPQDAAGAAETGAEAEEPEEFENRAARRARGKGASTTPSQPADNDRKLGGRGPSAGPRQWSNRRSG